MKDISKMLDERVKGLEKRLGDIEEWDVEGLLERVEEMEKRLKSIEEKVDEMSDFEDRITNLEAEAQSNKYGI